MTNFFYSFDRSFETKDRAIEIVAHPGGNVIIMATGESDSHDYWNFKIIRKVGEQADSKSDGQFIRHTISTEKNEEKDTWALVSSEKLMLMDRSTLVLLKSAKRVVTDNNCDFEILFTLLKDRIKDDPAEWEGCLNIGAFFTISTVDFDIINRCLDSSVPLPKNIEEGNKGHLVHRIN